MMHEGDGNDQQSEEKVVEKDEPKIVQDQIGKARILVQILIQV